jgi:hypothetical protein
MLDFGNNVRILFHSSINQKNIRMKLHLAIIATQLIKGAESFLGQPVKSQFENPFALIPYQGTLLTVNEGNWLVEYHDGTKEVWTDEQIRANTNYNFVEVNEDVRIEDENINATPATTDETPITNPEVITPDETPVTEHVITEEDLTAIPELTDQDIKDDDVIGIPEITEKETE